MKVMNMTETPLERLTDQVSRRAAAVQALVMLVGVAGLGTVTSGCGAITLIPTTIVKSIVELIDALSGDELEKANELIEKLQGFQNPDGTYTIPEDEEDEIEECIEELKEYGEELEDAIDQIVDMIEDANDD